MSKLPLKIRNPAVHKLNQFLSIYFSSCDKAKDQLTTDYGAFRA